MILFLFGEDTFRSRAKLNQIIQRYQKIHKSGFNLCYLDLKECSFSDFWDKLRPTSMFKEKKLFILFNAFNNSEFCESFLADKKRFLDSEDIIVFYEQDIKKNTKIYKFLKSKAKTQEFNLLTPALVKKWAKKEIENCGAAIEMPALDKLVSYTGSNLWQMSNEINKLVNYANGAQIKEKDVELLVRSKVEADIFKTIDAIGARNKSAALTLLHKHLEKGDSVFYLLTMIAFQVRNLLVVKDLLETGVPYCLISKKAKIHPFVVKKAYALCQQIDLSYIKQLFQRLFEIDLETKTGVIAPELALDLFISET